MTMAAAPDAAGSARVAIIGGGFAGAVAALRLIEHTVGPLTLTMLEPRPRLGRGIAYSTTEAGHLMNGPARILSLFPEDPLHLARWLEAEAGRGGWRPPQDTPWELSQPPRWIFGSYVEEHLARAVAAEPGRVALRHRRARATDIELSDHGVRITTDDGEWVAADAAVIATGIFRKTAAVALSEDLRDDPRYVPDPYAYGAFKRAAEARDAVILGSGLTMLDAVVSLDRAGFRGPIRVVSRRGQLVEQRRNPEPWENFLSRETPSLRALVRAVQCERRKLASRGEDWQRLIPVVREQVPIFWPGLSDPEKNRFARHLQGVWQTCVHLAPTESHRLLERLRAEGRLVAERGRVVALSTATDGRLSARLRVPGVGERRIDSDLVICCLGNTFDWSRHDDPLVRALIDGAMARPHSTGLGIEVSVSSHAVIDAAGTPSLRLYAIGHPMRGASWESSSVRELAQEARRLAESLGALLGTQSMSAAGRRPRLHDLAGQSERPRHGGISRQSRG